MESEDTSSDTSSDTEGVRSLPCPVCGSAMRVDTLHGTQVDVCDEHGMWLDDGELEKMMLNKQVKGLHKRTQKRDDKERKARRRRWIEDAFG